MRNKLSDYLKDSGQLPHDSNIIAEVGLLEQSEALRTALIDLLDTLEDPKVRWGKSSVRAVDNEVILEIVQFLIDRQQSYVALTEQLYELKIPEDSVSGIRRRS